MKKLHILESPQDFKILFRQGRRMEHPLFGVIIRKNSLSHSRFAFIISRAVVKSAVARNRLKRRAREWIRKHQYGLSPSRDVALIFKKGAATTSRKKFYEELAKVIGLLGR